MRIPLTTQAQDQLKPRIQPGDITVDATLGNGYDTEFLAQQLGEQGWIFGFDVQAKALEQTRNRLKQIQCNLQLFQQCHSTMKTEIPKSFHKNIKAIMFNLGYLPGSDKQLITQTKTTLMALSQAAEIIAINGLISIMAYPGHPDGEQETQAVINWTEKLDSQQFKLITHSQATHFQGPQLMILEKVRSCLR